MFKKIIARLVTNFQPRMNLGEKRFNEEANRSNVLESELARERHEQTMNSRDKKYVSERTAPNEVEITGPSDSEEA